MPGAWGERGADREREIMCVSACVHGMQKSVCICVCVCVNELSSEKGREDGEEGNDINTGYV